MKHLTHSLVLGALLVSSLFPVSAMAGGGHAGPSVRVRVRVQVGGPAPFQARPVFNRFAHGPGFRPVCAVGFVGRGCFTPVRKSLRFVGRVGVAAGRFAGRAVAGAARGVAIAAAAPFRFLFGRRFR